MTLRIYTAAMVLFGITGAVYAPPISVPEPTSLALLGLALGGLALTRKLRK